MEQGDPIQNVEAQLKQLLALPLFALLDEDLVDALQFEAKLSAQPTGVAPDTPQRPGYVRFEHFEADEILINQGDFTTRFLVVLDGMVSALRVEPSGRSRGVELVDTYGKGDWFGEVSALSNIPSLTTARAQSPCDVAVLEARLFKKLYMDDREGSGTFSDAIDERYREKSLLLHLQWAPLFARQGKERLVEIQKGAEFVTFEKDEVIASQGGDARDFFLVRSGAVKASRDVNGRKQILAYYRANSSFGDHAAATEDATWPCTLQAMVRTDVVRIPRKVFEELLVANPRAHRTLTRRANAIVSERGIDELYGPSRDERDPLAEDEIEVMVERQSAKGGRGLVIDKTKCVRCNACLESCASVHGDGVPRLSKVGSSISTNDVLITACYNCDVPECMAECDYGAIRRDAQGMIRFVYDNCVGCTNCTKGCPYGVIRMIPAARGEPASERPSLLHGLLSGIPGLGRVFAPKRAEPSDPWSVANIGGEAVEVGGKAVKCDNCAGLPFEACVYNCPTSAIHRRSAEELFRA